MNPVRKEVLVFTCTGLVLAMTATDGPGFWVGALHLAWRPPACWRTPALDAPAAGRLLVRRGWTPALCRRRRSACSLLPLPAFRAGSAADAAAAYASPACHLQLTKMDDVIAAGMTANTTRQTAVAALVAANPETDLGPGDGTDGAAPSPDAAADANGTLARPGRRLLYGYDSPPCAGAGECLAGPAWGGHVRWH